MSNEQNTPIETPSDNITFYRLHVELIGTNVPIWRDIVVPSNILLYDLHAVIQMAMDWNMDFDYKFVIGKKHIHGSMLSDDPDNPQEDVVQMGKALEGMKQFTYTYGKRNQWKCQITVESTDCMMDIVIPYLPYCISGEGVCPPEELKGAEEYNKMCAILNGPRSPEKAKYLDWLDEHDYPTPKKYPPKFKLKDANEALEDFDFMTEDEFKDDSDDEGLESDDSWFDQWSENWDRKHLSLFNQNCDDDEDDDDYEDDDDDFDSDNDWFNEWNEEHDESDVESDVPDDDFDDYIGNIFGNPFEELQKKGVDFFVIMNQNWEGLDDVEITKRFLDLCMPQLTYTQKDIHNFLKIHPETSKMYRDLKRMQRDKRELDSMFLEVLQNEKLVVTPPKSKSKKATAKKTTSKKTTTKKTVAKKTTTKKTTAKKTTDKKTTSKKTSSPKDTKQKPEK